MPRHLTEHDLHVGPVEPDPTTPFWVKTATSPPELLGWDPLAEEGAGGWVAIGGGGGGGGGVACDLYGDGVATTIDVAHGLATSCLLVEVTEVTSGDALVHGTDYTWLVLDDDTIRVVFTIAPATENVRIAVAAGAAGGAAVPSWVTHLAAPDDNPAWADEFATPTLHADWVEVTPSGTAEWTQGRGVLSSKFFSQGTASCAAILFPRELQVGETLETKYRYWGPVGNHMMAGPVVTNGALTTSEVVWLMPYTSTNWSLRAGTLASVSSTLRESAFPAVYFGGYYRLTRVDTNEWLSEGSGDGVSWSTFNLASVAFTLTGGPTHIGFGVSVWGGGAIPRLGTFEYLRVYNLT